MKILYLFPSEYRGGAEEYMLTIASAAAREKWQVYAAFPKRVENRSVVKDIIKLGGKYLPLEIYEPRVKNRWMWRAMTLIRFLRTLNTIRRIKPNIVYIVLPSASNCFGSIMACGFIRIPTVVVFQLVSEKLTFYSYHKKAYNWARSRQQHWVAISENNRQLISESFGINTREISLIYNGVNNQLGLSSSDNKFSIRQQIRDDLNLPENSVMLLTVGGLREQKGYDYIVPTIPHIRKEYPNIYWVWVGDGSQRKVLEGIVNDYHVNDAVKFLGYKEEVWRFYQAADFFLFPTRYEGGQSFALTEAMVSGLPIITTDASGIPEVIENKVHGVICRKEDSCDLLEATRFALSHREEMKIMGQNAKMRAEDFTEDKMVNNTLDLIRTMLVS